MKKLFQSIMSIFSRRDTTDIKKINLVYVGTTQLDHGVPINCWHFLKSLSEEEFLKYVAKGYFVEEHYFLLEESPEEFLEFVSTQPSAFIKKTLVAIEHLIEERRYSRNIYIVDNAFSILCGIGEGLKKILLYKQLEEKLPPAPNTQSTALKI